MKKRYKIEPQRAIKQLDAMAAEGSLAVQMILPMAEMMGWLDGLALLCGQAAVKM